MDNMYYFNSGWRFCAADAFPMSEAREKRRDSMGREFFEEDYDDSDWQPVTLPHTFNDGELFAARIQNSGSGQRRTAAFYRKSFTVPESRRGCKMFIEFEGMRQTCYLYINSHLAGYYEAGTAPFGFDLTPWIRFGGKNVIAVATDNTSTMDADMCIAETPNKPDVVPGSYLFPVKKDVPEQYRGVGFFWNCNDFNPSVGGITRPVKVHFKPEVYLTLPLYSNLRTKGCYIYASDFDTAAGTARITALCEVRNESDSPAEVYIAVTVYDRNGAEAARFESEPVTAAPSGRIAPELSITPPDAYEKELLPNGSVHYRPVEDESAVAPTVIASKKVREVKAVSDTVRLRFWSADDPYLYKVKTELYSNGALCDSAVIETGFRKAGYDPNKGVMINDSPVWLRGYAQRASNEWAAIGIAPEWLKDTDAALVRESNANHIRWMHVAASPADIRACDRNGIICTQPAGDKERENFGRQWDQRVELMRDIIIYFRNSPSVLFWEAGNNSISAEHMREMRLLKEDLDPFGGRFMGCRTLNTKETVAESEYVGTMLNRHAARFTALHGPVTETEYSREEAPRRVWDDFTPPDFDYRNKWLGAGARAQKGYDYYDLTSEDLMIANARGYSEFFSDRIGGASHKDWYCAAAALCWTDSAQHGRQAASENARMSGRVDPARVKKQSFDVFRVMQSPVPAVKLAGHWNYPADPGSYIYAEKKFNGEYWAETGRKLLRDARHKTVYIVGSIHVKSVRLYVNGALAGECEKPIHTFIFPVENVDITQNGYAEAVAVCYDGTLIRDRIETASAPAKIVMTAHTAPGGLRADGADVMYADIAVTDSEGRICPVYGGRIDFELEGAGEFLGGYTSGRFNGFGRADSVIHKNHVFAECGTSRVFIRSASAPGAIRLAARAEGIGESAICVQSVFAETGDFTSEPAAVIYRPCASEPPAPEIFPSIPEADADKYTPETECLCKILVNGQEPDTRGVQSVNKNGSVWGAVICILDRMKDEWNMPFEYEYDAENKRLTLTSGAHKATAEAGRTHITVDGEERLMDGEPYISRSGQLVMEVNAIVPYIEGVSVCYDDEVNVLRIEG